jgi:hypothetical protein
MGGASAVVIANFGSKMARDDEVSAPLAPSCPTPVMCTPMIHASTVIIIATVLAPPSSANVKAAALTLTT